MELLQSYDWPGNVRELQNEVQRLVIQIDAGGFVTPELLSPRIRQVEGVIERVRPTKGTLKEMMDQLERWLLIEALREHDNNKTAAAQVARHHARRPAQEAPRVRAVESGRGRGREGGQRRPPSPPSRQLHQRGPHLVERIEQPGIDALDVPERDGDVDARPVSRADPSALR